MKLILQQGERVVLCTSPDNVVHVGIQGSPYEDEGKDPYVVRFACCDDQQGVREVFEFGPVKERARKLQSKPCSRCLHIDYKTTIVEIRTLETDDETCTSEEVPEAADAIQAVKAMISPSNRDLYCFEDEEIKILSIVLKLANATFRLLG